ncbi:MAG TPA: DNA methylase [Verrucomicrobiota bacterium]|nr:DNA methylase [Verrucomicrobiota bacterium]
MAESLAHRWGQIIGDCFEAFVRNILADVAQQHSLYLDFKRPRQARGGQGKVTWQDGYGNKHDLDYVLERGGTEGARGVPVAFIESAWRRYTKHSKNKVQEIEAAVMPVALTFSRHQPFLGAVLAGEFTRNALAQLESKGFAVLHVPYESILTAFKELGIDASSEDGVGGTPEGQFRKKISRWEALPQPLAIDRWLAKLHALHGTEIADFKRRLEASVTRRVSSVRLTVLRGYSVECADIESAIAYLIEEEQLYRLREDGTSREAFEVQVRFNTGAKIDATFPKRCEAIAFLRSFAQP